MYPCFILIYDKHWCVLAKYIFYRVLNAPVSKPYLKDHFTPRSTRERVFFVFLEIACYNKFMPIITPKKSLGNLGETIAANYLKNKGYAIIALNYANPSGRRLGEIDIIAKDLKKDELVFVEVKARAMQKFKDTNPEENVNYRKRQKLDKIAYFYLKKNNLLSRAYRFDVIALWINMDTRRAKIRHIKAI